MENNEEKVELIKPDKKNKSNKKNNNNKTNKKIISPVISLLVGLILCTNSNQIIVYACYIIGAIILAYGVLNIYNYTQLKNKSNIVQTTLLNSGIIFSFIGLLIIILSGIIKTFINLILGLYLIVSGLIKLMNISDIYNSDKNKGNFIIVEASLFILMGLYTIFFQNIFFVIIGAWMVISAIIDLVNILKK